MTEVDAVSAAMTRINDAWLEGRAGDLAHLVHPGIVMALPDFRGRIEGRDAFVAGFRDFCENARVHRFETFDIDVTVVGNTAVDAYRYRMLYELAGASYEVEGRDLWVFERNDGNWIAVWRAMLDTTEKPL